MKNVIIRNIFVVGMYYWGFWEMLIDVVYYCKWEFNNLKDECVVVIYVDFECRRRVVYFRWEDSVVFYMFFKEYFLEGLCYVKVKYLVLKFFI